MRSLLPAEKTHYRKGLALGLTLAETFSVVIFVLLLACAALLRSAQGELNDVEMERDQRTADLWMHEVAMQGDDVSFASADAWLEYSRRLHDSLEVESNRAERAERSRDSANARATKAEADLARTGTSEEVVNREGELAAQVVALEDSLSKMGSELVAAVEEIESAAERVDSLADQVEVQDYVQPIREQIDETGRLDSAQLARVLEDAARTGPLNDSLALARRTIGLLARELDDMRPDLSQFEVVDSLDRELVDADQALDDALATVAYLQNVIDGLRTGTGIDPPPCWLDADGDPEYVFRIELSDGGMRLFNIAPPHRVETDREIMGHIAAIEDGRTYPPSDFLRVTMPFYTIGTGRTELFGPTGCRFWIRPVDLTGNRKEIFQERQEQLWRRFWFRW